MSRSRVEARIGAQGLTPLGGYSTSVWRGSSRLGGDLKLNQNDARKFSSQELLLMASLTLSFEVLFSKDFFAH